MFSFYDESRYSSFSGDTISKMDANDLKIYQEEYDRLTKKLLDSPKSKSDHSIGYLSSAYQHSITQQQELLRELAFYKALYDQEHQARRTSDADLLHSMLLLCGFLGAFVLLLMLPEVSLSPLLITLSLVFPVALSIAGLIYALGVVQHLDRRDPDFPFMYKASHKAILVFFILLPSAVLLLYSAIDYLRG